PWLGIRLSFSLSSVVPCSCAPRALRSFPTRRSSDLFNFHVHLHAGAGAYVCGEETALIESIEGKRGIPRARPPYPVTHGLWKKPDRKSTRLNSSHVKISYAVFCWKKKKMTSTVDQHT